MVLQEGGLRENVRHPQPRYNRYFCFTSFFFLNPNTKQNKTYFSILSISPLAKHNTQNHRWRSRMPNVREEGVEHGFLHANLSSLLSIEARRWGIVYRARLPSNHAFSHSLSHASLYASFSGHKGVIPSEIPCSAPRWSRGTSLSERCCLRWGIYLVWWFQVSSKVLYLVDMSSLAVVYF